MTVEGVALVHGGFHGGWCWDLLLPLLDLPAVTVDLPGRGARPVHAGSVTLDDCVAAVLEDVELAGWETFALVGHSMGGLTITETALRHPDRVAHLVYVAALVPAPGETIEQLLAGDAGVPHVDGAVPIIDAEIGKAMFGNDVDDERWAWAQAQLVPEAHGLFTATPSGPPPVSIPRTYVAMDRDVPVPPEVARRMVENAGVGTDVRTIDAGHDVMLSDPEALAAVLRDVLGS